MSIDTMTAEGKVQAGARRWGGWKWVGIVAGAIALLLITAAGLWMWMSYVPADLDYATTRLSNGGAYRVSYEPRHGPIAVNQIHAWTIHVETADGQPIEGATIAVDGDMPQHGHGLPTEPQVTQDLGGGDYLVEGLKFHMPGWWVVDYTITAGGQTDTVRFNLLLN
ncbi:MAG: FixH family protein [Chloroflexales bacterium]|nr:FixH family protein [Chloroflexales bacterium]